MDLKPPSNDLKGKKILHVTDSYALIETEDGLGVFDKRSKMWLFNIAPIGEVALFLMLSERIKTYSDETINRGTAVYTAMVRQPADEKPTNRGFLKLV